MRRPLSKACERARAQLSLRLDDELSDFEIVELRAHLKRCRACSDYESQTETVAEMLRTAPLEAPEWPVALPRRHRRRLLAPQLQVAVAIVAVVGATVLGMMRGTGSLAPSPRVSASPPASLGPGPARPSTRPAYLDSATYELRLIDHLLNGSGKRFASGKAIAA